MKTMVDVDDEHVGIVHEDYVRWDDVDK